MYITYESTQWAKDPSDPIRIGQFVLPPGRMPETLPKPDFMPSKLIRTSDMKVVSGTQVNEGYCAFSYAWSQSGDILVDPRTGKKNRFDQGKHKLIRPTASKQHPGNVEEYVRFETIIQQICRDFNIKYVWYDALCIDHNNLEEKHQDIGQMHRIYYNAYCVVALVPEFCIKVKSSRERKRLSQQDETADTYCRFLDALDEIPTAAWSKRLWTLTEAIQSQNLIYVGQNVHVFSDQEVPGVKHISQVKQRFARWNVGTMLFYAHKRTSTSDHDRVFAMANLFPDLMKHISIDYDQPFEDLMIQFYSLLAKKCITILFFGSHKKYKGKATIYQNAHDDDHNNEAIEDYDATSNDNKSDTISIRDD
ncbi:heterokaryon incompatibility protein-domain-containing protein, partial [Phascolomyces articulosus]